LRFLPTCFSFQKELAPARIKLQSVDGPDALTPYLYGDALTPSNSPDLDQPHFLNGIFAWLMWENRKTPGNRGKQP